MAFNGTTESQILENLRLNIGKEGDNTRPFDGCSTGTDNFENCPQSVRARGLAYEAVGENSVVFRFQQGDTQCASAASWNVCLCTKCDCPAGLAQMNVGHTLSRGGNNTDCQTWFVKTGDRTLC